MTRRSRNIEIFSISALDLFASAMGAFVLLSVMMLPYYHKGKELEEQIARLEPAAAESAAQASGAEALAQAAAADLAAIEAVSEVDLLPEKRTIAQAERRQGELEGEIAAAAKAIEEKKAAASAPAEVKQPAKAAAKVTFRFLGLKTDAERYLILVDGASRIKDRATNLPAILKSILSVMGPQKEYAIAFYRYTQGQMVYDRWPSSGFRAGGPATEASALDFLRGAYQRMAGGSATAQALRRALSEQSEAVILLSDGVVFPRHNENKRWQEIVDDVTRENAGSVEINAVAIGIFNRDAAFWSFLNALRRRNGGDLKAIPP